MYERAQFDQAIGEALVAEVPNAWCGAVLVLRVERNENGSIRCRQAIRGPGDSAQRPGPDTRAAVGTLIQHLTNHDQVFRAANYALSQHDGEWSLTADFTYEGELPRTWSLPSLAEKYAVVSCARQMRLGRYVKHARRELDLEAGLLRYNTLPLPFAVLLIGTANETGRSWRWGWTTDYAPLERCIDSSELLDIGLRHGVPELMADGFPFDPSRGHVMAALATVLVGGSAYVRVPIGDVSHFVTVLSESLDAEPLCTAKTFESIVRTTFDTGWVRRPERALRHGVTMLGGVFGGTEGAGYVGELPDGTPFRCEVDAQGKLGRVLTT